MPHRLKSKQQLSGLYAENSEEFRSRNDAASFWYKLRDVPKRTEGLTRRAFIGESMLLALAVKIGVAFAGEGAQSDNGAQTAIGSKIAKVRIAEFSDSGIPLGLAAIGRIMKSDAEWKRQLYVRAILRDPPGGN